MKKTPNAHAELIDLVADTMERDALSDGKENFYTVENEVFQSVRGPILAASSRLTPEDSCKKADLQIWTTYKAAMKDVFGRTSPLHAFLGFVTNLGKRAFHPAYCPNSKVLARFKERLSAFSPANV